MATTPLSAICPRLTPGEPAPKIEGSGRRLMFWLGSARERRLLVRIHAGRRVVAVGTLLVISVRASRGVAPVEVAATAKEEAVELTQAAEQLACKQLVEVDYLDDALPLVSPSRSCNQVA
jgi:hypothetical protein